MDPAPDYLGDGVYATFDGFGVKLTTGHHEEAQATNTVVLEPEVWHALRRYVERIRQTHPGKTGF